MKIMKIIIDYEAVNPYTDKAPQKRAKKTAEKSTIKN